MWGAMKGAVCKGNPYIFLELKEASQISSGTFLRLNCLLFLQTRYVDECLQARGASATFVVT
jgi:hypothetical protein